MKRTILGLAALALAVLACGGPEGVSSGPDVAMLEPTGPKATLRNVEIAFDYRHRKILQASLCDDFAFLFGPEDVGANVNGYVIPAEWTRDEFCTALAHIFTDGYLIDADITTYAVGKAGPGQTEFLAADVPFTFNVYNDMRDGYYARGFCDFELRGNAQGDGKTYWRVLRWWDNTYVEPSDDEIEEKTFGRILAMYH
jgi:hypothetical protein